MSVPTDLVKKHCTACEADTPPLDHAQVAMVLRAMPGWEIQDTRIVKSYRFKDYYETMAFVNAIAWISHRENHHPDLEVGYNRCGVSYSTHAIGGISENDLICAAKVDHVLADD